MELVENNFRVGTRIEDAEGYKGTVKYIGSVAHAKNQAEIWLGIEWDRQSRGKHDGSCVDSNNVLHRYFECPPGAGSFVKPGKVHRGKTFIDALREKYVSMDAPEIAPDDVLPDAYVVTSNGAMKNIEFVGEKKIRKRQQLHEVVSVALRNASVNVGGDGVAELAGHFTELDLQDNLLSDWIEVARIVQHMPFLRDLQLHGNKLGDLTEEVLLSPDFPSGCLGTLRVLAVNFCGLTSFHTLSRLESELPLIEELYAAANTLTDLSPVGPAQFPCLRILDLSSCGLASWADVCASLGPLAHLEELLMDSNPIEQLQPQQPGLFAQLRRLSLSSTKLASWADVDALHTYSPFSCLRLTHIPLFAGKGASEVRPEVIARIGRLQVFNGSPISSRERTDAEKAYLRRILRQKAATESTEENLAILVQAHPRFSELDVRYADELLPMGAGGTTGLQSMASDMIAVTFQNLAYSSGGSLEPIQRNLPSSLTVEKVRLIVKQLFGVEPQKQLLSIRLDKGAVVPTLMDEDSATLRYYGAGDGAVDIFVNDLEI